MNSGSPLDRSTIFLSGFASKRLILNVTGSYLWEQLSEPRTADDLARAVCGRFSGIELANALDDVKEILEQMMSQELVIRSEAFTQPQRERLL
jgi:hypothetical protein